MEVDGPQQIRKTSRFSFAPLSLEEEEEEGAVRRRRHRIPSVKDNQRFHKKLLPGTSLGPDVSGWTCGNGRISLICPLRDHTGGVMVGRHGPMWNAGTSPARVGHSGHRFWPGSERFGVRKGVPADSSKP